MKLFLGSGDLQPHQFDTFRELLGKPKASKALFILTAAVPYGFDPRPEWLERSLNDMKQLTEEYDETTLDESDFIPTSLDEYDLVFISGGNVYYLAYMLKKTGFDRLITEYINKGKVYAGSSAGAVIVLKEITPFKESDDPEVVEGKQVGLDIIDYAIIPHADNKKYEDIIDTEVESFSKLGYEVIKLNDNQVIVQTEKGREII